jgi:DNA-binding transcriptional LysR family regulator
VDRLEAMAVFVAVADLQGFAPAARRMGLSASAVTRLVAALEEHLSTRLLQRTTRSVTLTDAGARYLERAKRILSDVGEAEAAAGSERGVPTGRLVVTAPSVFGRIHVAPLMAEFLAKYPAVSGELDLGDRMTPLVEEGIDAAVRIGELEDSSYVARQVGATGRVVVASPAYLARRKKPRTPEDLERHEVIQLTALTPTRQWRFFHDGRESSVTVAARYVTNSADAAIAHAERGGGLAMLLLYQAVEAVRAGRLTVVLRDFEPPPRPIHIVYPTTRLLSAKVRAFTELVVASRDWTFVDL